MAKTWEEINSKIKQRKAVVVTAEEMIHIVAEKGTKRAAQQVDVVTTGTFGPMCSSGMYINIGQPKPKIKLGGGVCYLNDVPAYPGFAAVDLLLGCSQVAENDPLNREHPGQFKYGGGHVIEDLVAGKNIRLSARAYGTDCYPRKKLDTYINIKDLNEAILFNPRNAYQNYNVAVNLSDKIIYTYMGVLRPKMGNINYSSAGQLSPLLNDPLYRTIGIGTRIFLGGGIGYVSWHGTQHSPATPRNEKQIPLGGAGTLAVTGDLKQMSPEYLVGTSMTGYGSTLTVGIGIPIPILDEEMAQFTAVRDEDITAPVIDYSDAYPNRKSDIVGRISYAELRTGKATLQGKEIPTGSLSSYYKARIIANTLKQWIEAGEFVLTQPVQPLPGPESGMDAKALKERPVKSDLRTF